MHEPESHTLEYGCTYWVHPADGNRLRIDWSDPDETWLRLLGGDEAKVSPPVWLRVLNPVIVVLRGQSLSLTVQKASGESQQWVSAPIVCLIRSSKSDLPEAVWGPSSAI